MCFAVIKLCLRPVCSRVALVAFFAKTTFMRVIVFVAAVTVFRQGLFQYAGAMAVIAMGGNVSAEQREVGFFIVIEFWCWFPFVK